MPNPKKFVFLNNEQLKFIEDVCTKKFKHQNMNEQTRKVYTNSIKSLCEKLQHDPTKLLEGTTEEKIQKLHNAIIQLNSVDEKYLNQNSTRFLDFEDYIKRKYYKNDNADPKKLLLDYLNQKKMN